MLLQLPFSIPLSIFLSGGVYTLYQIERVWLCGPEDKINQPLRVEWYKKNRYLLTVITLVASGVGGVAIFWLSSRTIVACSFLSLISLVYVLPHGARLYRLKSNWVVKPLAIAGCWTVGGVLLPAIESQAEMNITLIALFVYRFLLITSNVLLADLPDRRGDEFTGLRTLAHVLSPEGVQQWAVILAALGFAVGLVQGLFFRWPVYFFIDLIGALILVILALKVHGRGYEPSHFYYGFVVDLVIAWPMITILVHFVFS